MPDIGQNARDNAEEVADLVPLVPLSASDKKSVREIASSLLTQGYPMFLRGLVIASEFYIRSLYLSSMDDSNLIAANSLVSICDTTTAIFCVGCISTLSPVIGQNIHNYDPEYIGMMFRQAEWLAAIISVPVIAFYLTSSYVMRALKQDDYVIQGVHDYFSTAVFGFLPLVLMLPQQTLLIGLKRPLRAFATELTRSLLQCIAGYFLVTQAKLGFRGLGYSLSIAASITFILNTLSLVCDKSLSSYKLFTKKDLFVGKELFYLAKKGIPVGLEYALDHFAALINTFLISTRGKQALLATQIASQYGLFLSISSEANSQAVSVMVSYAYGQKNYRDCQSYLMMGMFIASVLPVIGLSLFISKPAFFVNPYLSEQEQTQEGIVEYCRTFLMIEGIRQIAKGTQFAGAGTLIGLLDTAFPTKMSVLFVLTLSSALASYMAFGTNIPAAEIYATRVLGVLLAIIGIMAKFCYHKRTILQVCQDRLPLLAESSPCVSPNYQAAPENIHNYIGYSPNREAGHYDIAHSPRSLPCFSYSDSSRAAPRLSQVDSIKWVAESKTSTNSAEVVVLATATTRTLDSSSGEHLRHNLSL